MTLIREEAAVRMRRDHDLMIDLIQRIKASCTQIGVVDNCKQCQPGRREVCNSNVEQLVRAFVEVTLKHNAMESLYMEECVPPEHRIAHNQAHMTISEQLKAIRVVLSGDGNCVLAIEGIDHVLASLQAHFVEYDRHLEGYLLEPA
jgi:hemerythrin